MGAKGGRAVALTDWGLLLLRLGAGGALITHGYPKLFGGPGKTPHPALVKVVGTNFPGAVERGGVDAFSSNLERMGFPKPRQAALSAGLAEFGGGLALALGFKTRVIAPAVLFTMLVAIRKVHWKTGFTGQGGYEMASLFALIATTLTLTGPGNYSLDGLLRRNPNGGGGI
jgi:putative oxidoreductase